MKLLLTTSNRIKSSGGLEHHPLEMGHKIEVTINIKTLDKSKLDLIPLNYYNPKPPWKITVKVTGRKVNLNRTL